MTHRSTLFLLWVLQGLTALVWLASLPTNTEKGFIFGLSLSRLALMGVMLFLSALSAVLFRFQQRFSDSILSKYHKPIYIITIIVTLLSPATIAILNALGRSSEYIYGAYASRLAPLAFWLALSALELAIYLATKYKYFHQGDKTSHVLLKYTFFILIILAIVVLFIAITKFGISPYNDGSWGLPTTPLLEWQIILALIFGLAFLVLESRWLWPQKDRYVCLLTYAFTCLLWLTQPINPGFFATPPRAPNFEIYPFSDALIYAQYAQSALVGNGFMWPEVPTRPLYISFLTWLHAIAGQDYLRVINLQTLVLAGFAPILYLLGKEIGGRPLGIGLVLLAALRDLTANMAATFANNYTYSKLFFSEIPAALLTCLFTLLIIRWLRHPKPAWYPLMVGGVLGLSSLIRLQSAILLLPVILIGFFVIKNKKRFLSGSVLLILGLALTLIPWLVRNFQATGGIVLDNPISQTMVLARRWGGDSGNTLIPHLPGENDAQYSSRMTRLALASLRADPGRILGSAVNHFFNNEISNLLVFPIRDRLENPGELIWPTHAFWQSWNGQPALTQIPIIAFYIFLLCLGLAATYQTNGLIGLLPLVLSLVYNAWTALFLSSGDRFLVPIDWAVYLYLFLGLLTLAKLVFIISSGVLTDHQFDARKDEIIPVSWKKIGATAILILFCGASIPLTETIFPKIYNTNGSTESLQVESGTSDLITLQGRAVYPRWYDAEEGEPGSAKLGYGRTDQARLVFFLVGQENTLVIFPSNSAPGFFPNASDVIITGSHKDGVVYAQKIIVSKNGKSGEYLQ